MFDENEFVSRLLLKAESLGMTKEAQKEIELFKEKGKLEYLSLIGEFVAEIRETVFDCPLIRMAGGSTICGYLLGIHMINPLVHNLSSTSFFSSTRPTIRFDVTLPFDKQKEAINILVKKFGGEEKPKMGSIHFFGKDKEYPVGIYGNTYLDRYLLAYSSLGEALKGHIPYRYEQEIVDYMLKDIEEDGDSFHLDGCVFGGGPGFLRFLKASNPKSLEELSMAIALYRCEFKDYKKTLKDLGEYGLLGVVGSREQMLSKLSQYDIEEERILTIIDALVRGKELFTSDRLLLESHEVPQHIIEGIDNLQYIGFLSYVLQEMEIIYRMAAMKRNGPKTFLDFCPPRQ